MKVPFMTKKSIIFCLFFIFAALMIFYVTHTEHQQSKKRAAAAQLIKKSTYTVGWIWQEPYQYKDISGRVSKSGDSLTGMDIEFIRTVNDVLKDKLTYKEIARTEWENALMKGEIALLSGMRHTAKRAKDYHFSKAYRFEEDAFFSMTHSVTIDAIDIFLKEIKNYDKKIAFLKNYSYVSDALNTFIADKKNKENIIFVADEIEALDLLLANEISGFFADRLTATTVAWREGKTANLYTSSIPGREPIHIVFNKKIFSLDKVGKYNSVIEYILEDGEYDNLISWYLFPLILNETLDATWFKILEIIGVLALSITGVASTFREKTSIVGSFILCVFPSFTGIILRDLILGVYPISVMKSPMYMYLVLLLISLLYVLKYLGRKNIDKFIPHLEDIAYLSTAIGASSLAVNGVIIALSTKASPIWIWGPFFAFFTSVSGVLCKNIIQMKRSSILYESGVMGLIPIIWGLILSISLTMQTHYLSLDMVFYTITFSVVGSLITFGVVYVFQERQKHNI